MKIAQIAPPWISIPPKNYGGTEQVISALTEEQVKQGHDVTLFATGDAQTSAKLISYFPKALTTQKVPWAAHLKPYYHLSSALEHAKEFDIIHTHLSSSSDLYLFPLTAALQTAHITTVHSHFPFDRVQTWTGDADDYFLQKWGENVPCVTISEQERSNAPKHLQVIGVVYNGLAMQNYPFKERKRENILVWLGRFIPDKGVHLAIEVAKRAHMPIVLAGTIDRAQQDSLRYFHEQIEPHIDNKQVKYIGPVNKQQKSRLLSRASGFLNPIQWEEPFGMVMIEAMAMGCPVISFKRGAAPELIRDGETGFLVETLDEMVEAIPKLGEIEQKRTHQHVEEHFSARSMAQNYEKIYQQVRATNPV